MMVEKDNALQLVAAVTGGTFPPGRAYGPAAQGCWITNSMAMMAELKHGRERRRAGSRSGCLRLPWCRREVAAERAEERAAPGGEGRGLRGNYWHNNNCIVSIRPNRDGHATGGVIAREWGGGRLVEERETVAKAR